MTDLSMKPKDRINLWIVNQYAKTANIPGPTRHFDFASRLVKKGYQITIFCGNIHYNTYQQLVEIPSGQNYIIQEYEGIRYVWIRTLPYSNNGIRRYLNILSFYLRLNLRDKEKKLGRPDIILGSSFHPFSIWASLQYKKATGIPFIAEIRDLWPETMIQLGASKYHPAVVMMDYIQKQVYKGSDAIVLLFPKAHLYIEQLKLGIPRSKMSWIPNGVDVEVFKSPPKKSQQIADPKYFNILNAGSLGKVYALEYLMEAAAILQEKKLPIRIHLIGSGPLEEKLRNMKEDLGLDNVIFNGPVPKNEMPHVLSQFDVLYASLMNSPLYKWGMSLNKIHEYLSAAKPVVFAVNAINNPVNDSECGYTVASDQPKQIAETIERLYNLPSAERTNMGERGYKYAKGHFDYNILANRYDDVIRKTLFPIQVAK